MIQTQTALAIRKPKAIAINPASYVKLKKRIAAIIEHYRKLVKENLTQMNWEIGREADLFIRKESKGSSRATYDKKLVAELAKGFGYKPATFYFALRYFRENPIFSPGRKLGWRKERDLLAVDRTFRDSLALEAEEKGWSRRDLDARIKETKLKLREEKSRRKDSGLKRLIAKRGEIGAYEIKEGEIDLGFAVTVDVPARYRKKFKDGDFIRVGARSPRPGGGTPPLQKYQNANRGKIYTYVATVKRVVDGDTLWVKIDLGLGPKVTEKLRLRGVYCDELKMKKGPAAKKFVERELARATSVIVTTTKPDKWDRYLTDLYYTTPEGEEIYLNQRLLDTGHASLVTRAPRLEDWDKE